MVLFGDYFSISTMALGLFMLGIGSSAQSVVFGMLKDIVPHRFFGCALHACLLDLGLALPWSADEPIGVRNRRSVGLSAGRRRLGSSHHRNLIL